MTDLHYDYAVIGGDMRQVYLVQELAKEDIKICHFALCQAPNAFSMSASSLNEAICASSCILCPIPLCKKGHLLNQSAYEKELSIDEILPNLKENQFFFGGCIPEYFKKMALKKGVYIFDFMEETSLSIFNTIATAEGAICEAIKESPLNLWHSQCAVLGYGKCGCTLTNALKGMACHVYVAANPKEEQARGRLIADQVGNLEDFGKNVSKFDFIFNTIPSLVISDKLLKQMKSTVTILDIASMPGGVDFEAARQLGVHAFLCPGLPGKYSPLSSAKGIKETMETLLNGGFQ